MIKEIRYLFEAAAIYLLYLIFWVMPVDMASTTGGWIGEKIGPYAKITNIARKNLSDTFPEKSEAEREQIIRKMWNNMGRIIAEYPHLTKIAKERTKIINSGSLGEFVKKQQPIIVMAGHLGNWEISATAAMEQYNLHLDIVYRKPNNRWIDNLLNKTRCNNGKLVTIPKSKAGTIQLVKAIKAGRSIGILIDQKYNEGIPALFFDRPAMTSPAFAELGLKYDHPIVPSRCKRLNGAYFEITVFEPLKLYDEDNNPLPPANIIKQAHDLLEDWIRETPEQWLWTHKRWSPQAIERYEAMRKAA